MLMIRLTPEQADAVRGESTPHHALMPSSMADGDYCLPVAVLSDPAHARWHDYLAALPQFDYTPPPPLDVNE